ncbi:MAG TPA: pantoate--beta-alanine ligase [Dehalococcoidia bacterium]|nr:pantoate--beta-alanine ligase [Dehalococcoidia bacterium]
MTLAKARPARRPTGRTLEIAETIIAMRAARRRLTGSVGFVPTMGYLHEGHISLMRLAREQNDHVVVSIFVNPTQFGPNEDFERYPRDAERDLRLCREAGVEVVFFPTVDQIYPPGYATYVNVEAITDRLEGAVRPGHFRGVATVVAKLFNIVQPDRAYFGQKDAQQVLVVQKMVEDLNMPLEIVVGPTVREPDGLALSSRNVYLTPEQRERALVLSRSLRHAETLYAAGVRDADRIRREMVARIEAASGAVIDYVSVADARTTEELDRIQGRALVSLAVRFGPTRLIDNVILG